MPLRSTACVLAALLSVCRTAAQERDGSQATEWPVPFNASNVPSFMAPLAGSSASEGSTPTPTTPSPTSTTTMAPSTSTPPTTTLPTRTRTPLPSTPNVSATPVPTPANDTIQFPPPTTLPTPPPTTSVQLGEEPSLLPYSVAGGLTILAIICVILFVIIRRNRESEVRHPRQRTQDMSEMFLSTSTRQEELPEIQSLDSDDSEFRLDDSSASHDIVDDTFNEDESVLSSPRPYFSEKSDSYRSSFNSDANGSVTIFFDDLESERSASTTSSNSLGFIRDSEMSRL